MKRPYNYEFVIDRSKWLNGSNIGNGSALHLSGGLSCCMGLLAQDCGVPTRRCLDVPTLAELDARERGSLPFQADESFGVLGVIYATNDDASLTPKEREKRLRELLANIGVRVTFRGRQARARP